MKIGKLEDEWNAAKYKEKPKNSVLSYLVSIKTEKGLAECSQGEQGEEVEHETQQNSSQEETKLMELRDEEQSITRQHLPMMSHLTQLGMWRWCNLTQQGRPRCYTQQSLGSQRSRSPGREQSELCLSQDPRMGA